MPVMTIALADLEEELRALPRRDQAALRRAITRTVMLDAQRWIQWSIRGGGTPPTARPPKPAPQPRRKRPGVLAKLWRKVGGVLGMLRGGRPRLPKGLPGGKAKDACARRDVPGYRVPIDTGDYANSWRSEVLEDGTALFWSASSPPIKAGVIEGGRRPGPIPIAPLAEWVRRKLGCHDVKKARSIAFAISKTASRQKRQGLGVLERAHPKIVEALAVNVERELRASISAAVRARGLGVSRS